MENPTQFSPAPSQDLEGQLWARGYNELKALGHKKSQRRAAAQTEDALFLGRSYITDLLYIRSLILQEVIDARIYDGVHYRNSGDIDAAMGKQVGNLAFKRGLITP